MKLKRYKKKTIGTYIGREMILLIMGIVCAFIVINHYYKSFNKVITNIALMEAKGYITKIINKATLDIKFDKDLFVINKEDNEIKTITYNSYEATKLINQITSNIQDNLSDNYTLDDIPLGIVFKNGLLRNMGPMIKVKLDIMGNVISEIETEVKPYGINNALVEVRIKLRTNVKVILPLTTEDINIVNVIPISINIVNGSIPEAYIATYKN